MPEKIEISLQVPHDDPAKQNRFFSLRLKQELENEMSEYKRVGNIFVVSDTGGNFQNFCKILYRGQIIDKQLNWNFADGHVVLLGNCLDDNKDVIECLWLIYSLEEKAKRKAGYIHFILGNNELQNIDGQWRFRHPRYAKSESVRNNASTALFDASNELWRWLKTKNLIERIGHTLFMHGSMPIKLFCGSNSTWEINNLAKTSADTELFFKAPYISDIFHDISGNTDAEIIKNAQQKVDGILRRFRVKRIVTGYPSAKKIDLFYDNKIINVHTDHTSENSECLLIKGHHFFRIKNGGRVERLV